MGTPNTIEEAVFQVISALSAKDMERVGAKGLNYVHFSGGMQMRNHWSLWQDSTIRRDAIKRFGLAHADDLSGMIFEWVEAECRGETFDKEAYIARIQKHWKMFDTTSCGAMNLNEDGTPKKKVLA